MQFSTRTLIALFISAASATCVFGAAIASKRDVATLRNDVAVISSRINDLDGGLNAFSENPFYFPGAQDIHAGNVISKSPKLSTDLPLCKRSAKAKP
ncbi:hypothetical protein K435DRAFT_864708 [Dendrothele bispora CBS 962.96]|uniref:Fungal N-terminal domain-containing protein n=1 Tax=Dendrothele bispora (strain CBS 962.96) TaxID=1314807 RepID=A0A4S8LMQ1_DENBC|nr:hypothetical protein K435DRAFT_864708 [Dendrothele bispora CBS 962.96]